MEDDMGIDKEKGMSRRDFARTSALAGFAILTAKSGVAANTTDTLKVGLIGCGSRGTGAVINCLEGNSNLKFVGMADVFEDQLKNSRERIEGMRRRNISEQVDIEDDRCFVGFDAYQKLIDTDIDIVIHGTTPYCRPQHIEAAVDAGKHVFTEKPVAVDPVGVRQFIRASEKAQEKNLTLVAGTQRRHQKSYIETIKKIHDGAVGEILSGRAYWCGTLPFAHDRDPAWSDLEYRLRNWYAYNWVCGDNIVEQHMHNLDVINWALDARPVKVFASGGRTWKPVNEKYGDLFDQFSCDYEYPNGVHVTSMSRHWYDSASGVFEEVTGTKGKSTCRDLAQDDKDPYVQEHINMLASIRGEIPYLNEGVQVAEGTLTAMMGRMSAYTGQVVTWEDAMNSDLSIVPEVLDFDLPYPVGPVPSPGGPAA